MQNYIFPILFKVLGIGPSAAKSTIVPDTFTPEIEQNLDVVVTVRDRRGNPLEGIPVEIVISSGAVDVDVTPLSGLTDGNGEITFVLYSDTAVVAEVGVLVNEGPKEFTLTTSVEFVSP